VHEERKRVGRHRRLCLGRGGRLVRRRLDDLDLPGLELGAQLGEILLVEVVLERERLQGGLVDRLVLLGLVEERRDSKFKRGAQFFLTSFASSVSGERAGVRHQPLERPRGPFYSVRDQKNSPSRFRFGPLRPADLPLPRTAFR
jgi:hypothetical protein